MNLTSPSAHALEQKKKVLLIRYNATSELREGKIEWDTWQYGVTCFYRLSKNS